MAHAAQQPPESDTSTQFNPLLFSHNMQQAFDVWQEILQIIAQEDSFADMQGGDGMWHIASDYMQWMSGALQDPSRMMQMGYDWMANATNLWHDSMQRFMDTDTPAEDAPKSTTDKRFADASWQDNALFDYIKKQYLMTSSWMQDAVSQADDDMDDHAREKLNFYTQQWVDAMAPSNFMITNPEVLKTTLESNGENLLKGLRNLREDFERGKGKLAISTTDNKAFEVGKNLAATEGKVVFKNELFELIQYNAQTEKVFETPLLLIPAWINKFYIFDMQQKNSFARWLIEQGHSVFVISWVNPDESLRDKSFENYMLDGLLKAVEVTKDITQTKQINCMGYCLGGTLLASSLAYLHAKGEADQIASATYLTTMIDFTDPGELGVFIDEEQIQSIEAKMEKKGYLEGSDMAATFSMLRSNNMIWSFVVNNYMLGKEPFPFDLLYWNADSTRMPATLHSYSLRNLYHQNKLAKGELTLGGETIDVRNITTPSFILSTSEDHIAPWKSTYESTQLYTGDVTFVLAGSGHIAGVINPPVKNKYGYWVNDNSKNVTADNWLSKATKQEGSWWGHWQSWIAKDGDKSVSARTSCGSKKYPVLMDAPGSYVTVK